MSIPLLNVTNIEVDHKDLFKYFNMNTMINFYN